MQRQDARARLAAVVDELRGSTGASVILRGHDFRLRESADRKRIARAGKTIRRSARLNIVASASGHDLRPAARSQLLLVSRFNAFAEGHRELAKQHGMPAVALTDTGNLHGAVEFVQAAKQAGIKPILGT